MEEVHESASKPVEGGDEPDGLLRRWLKINWWSEREEIRRRQLSCREGGDRGRMEIMEERHAARKERGLTYTYMYNLCVYTMPTSYKSVQSMSFCH